MSAFSRNVIANLLAAGWTSLVQLVVVPILISLVGVASFALIGFYASLVAVLSILDLGLSTNLTRRMAGVHVSAPDGADAANSLKTYELIFLAGGALIAGCIVLGAPLIAGHWLSSESLSQAEIERSIRFIGLLVGLRWPMGPYIATLQGLQKQVGINALNAAVVTAASVGGLALLAGFSPMIEVFFAWQCVCAAVQLLLLRVLALRALPGSAAGRFAADTLFDRWRFATGLTAISLTAMILTQGDKLILAKLVTLEEFGYYSIALTVAGTLYVIMLPVFNAALPRLCEHVAAGDESALLESFHASANLMHALLVPVALFLILFPHETLQLWTRDPAIASRSAPLLALLATGTLLNGFMTVPFALQLARGNTSLGLKINLALCALLIPAIVVLTGRFGVAGGAVVSPILNGIYLLVGLPLTYRLCAGAKLWRSFYAGMARQQGPAVLWLLAVRLAFPSSGEPPIQALMLAAALILALAISILATPAAREMLLVFVRSRRRA